MTATQALIAEIEAELKPATRAELAAYLGLSSVSTLRNYVNGRVREASASRYKAWEAVLAAARKKKSRKSETR